MADSLDVEDLDIGEVDVSAMAFTVRGGKIVAIDSLSDPTRLRQLDLAALDERP